MLAILKTIENRWFKDRRSAVLTLRIDPTVISLRQIRAEVEAQDVKVEHIKVTPDQPGISDRVSLVLSRTASKNLTTLIDQLGHMTGVREISSGREQS